MKITLTYGLGISIAGAVLALLLYFLGYHSEPEKFQTGQTIGMIVGYSIIIVGLVLGMRAVRDASPDGSLTYGRAVGTGALITLFSGIFSAIFMLIYGFVINPGYHDFIYEMQVAKMEEQGMSAQAIEGAASMMRFFTGPIFIAIATVLFTPVMGTIFSLIIAIFVKRPPTATTPPPVQA